MDRVRAGTKKSDQLGVLKGAMGIVHRNIGANVGILFVFYQKLVLSNLIMLVIWLLLAIIPFCISPPPGFSWSDQSYKGTVGQDDEALEKSYFYYGAYQAKHTVSGYVYRMDLAYFTCVLLMFTFQIIQFVFGMAECSEDKITLEAEAPEAFRLVLGSHEYSVTNEGAIVCNIERFQKAVKHIAEFGTLEGACRWREHECSHYWSQLSHGLNRRQIQGCSGG